MPESRGPVSFDLPATWELRTTRRGAKAESPPGEITAEDVSRAIGHHFEVLQVQSVQPRSDAPPPARRRRGTNAAKSKGEVKVEVGPGENAVVLVEQDGAYFWIDGAIQESPRKRGAQAAKPKRTVTFALDLRTTTTGRPSPRRGFSPKLLFKPLKVIIFKFLAEVAVGKLVEHFEKDVSTGLVWIRSSEVNERFAPLGPGMPGPQLPASRPAKVLLLLHGTFSSTEGGYGHLRASVPGREFLSRAISTYDAVIGFDHRTLSEDPKTNADRLKAALDDLDPGGGIVLDAVTHSRGALVLRSLVEYLLGVDGPIRLSRAVMVAGPNAGTILASPAHWKDLIDLYTNLVVGASRVISLAAPQSALATQIISEATKGLAALVKAVTTAAVKESIAPGLAAMDPDGVFIKRLNTKQPHQPTPEQVWYAAITTDYEPDVINGPGHLPKRVGSLVADMAVDQLMGQANDLVVNIPSMTSVDLPAKYFKTVFQAPTKPTLFHTTYFCDADVVQHLAGLLTIETIPNRPTPAAGGAGVALPAGGSDSVVVVDADSTRETAQARVDAADADWSVVQRRRARGEPLNYAFERAEIDKWFKTMRPADTIGSHITKSHVPASELPVGRYTQVPPARRRSRGTVVTRDRAPVGVVPETPSERDRRPARKSTARIGALMSDRIDVGALTTVIVEVANGELQVAVGPDAKSERVTVNTDQPITITAVAKSNVIPIGGGEKPVALPSAGQSTLEHFTFRGERPGPGQIAIIATQGPAVLVRLLLDFSVQAVGDGPPSSITAQSVSVSKVVDLGQVTAPCDRLFIEENRATEAVTVDGATQYATFETRFDVRFLSDGKDLWERDVTEPIRGDRVRYVTDLYRQIEADWGSSSEDIKTFEAALKAFGGQLFDELVPERIQRVLWNNRKKISTIQVTSDDPLIPWELVHLKTPQGRLPKEDLFLANLGIVRWADGIGAPPRSFTWRATKRFVMAPEYPAVEGWWLNTAAEVEYLHEKLKVRDIEPTWDGLSKLITQPGAADLFHFAGHGMAPADNITQAGLVLRVNEDPDTGKLVPYLIPSTMIEQYADLTPKSSKGSRAVVFLNACQVGRAGYQLTSIGGFAHAFLKAGAGAFVSSLWSVGDDPAIAFCETFYDRLKNGDTIAAATSAARTKARADGDPTWLAYVVYGRPDATVSVR